MRILTKKRYQFGHGDTKVITTGNYAIEDVPDWVEKDPLFKLAKEDGDIEVLVSYSQDVSTITNDLDGWAQWKLTKYGVQFASIAKLMGKGGMLVW